MISTLYIDLALSSGGDKQQNPCHGAEKQIRLYHRHKVVSLSCPYGVEIPAEIRDREQLCDRPHRGWHIFIGNPHHSAKDHARKIYHHHDTVCEAEPFCQSRDRMTKHETHDAEKQHTDDIQDKS